MGKYDFIIEGTRLIKYCSGNPNAVIPNGVVTIAKEAFFDRRDIISVKMPNTVKVIEESAFRNCYKLETIKPSSNLTFVAMDAFNNTAWSTKQPRKEIMYLDKFAYRCRGDVVTLQKEIEVKEGTTGINAYLFDGMGVEKVILPRSLKNIGPCAFHDCHSLREIEIKGTLSYIGSGAFLNTPWYEEFLEKQEEGVVYIGNVAFTYKGEKATCPSEVTIKEGTTQIGSSLFSGCSKLTNVTLPSSIQYIGGHAFQNAGVSSIVIPEGVTYIDDYTFYGCKELASVSFPSSLRRIKGSAFSNCNKVGRFELNEGLIEIGSAAFRCKDTVIVLPSSLEIVAEDAFDSRDPRVPNNNVTIMNNSKNVFDKACYSAFRIIAPFIPLNDYSNKMACVLGYLSNQDLYNEKLKEEYNAYISKQITRILPEIYKHDLVEGIILLIALGKIDIKNYQAKFLEPAIKNDASKCADYLRSWGEGHFNEKDVERELLRQQNKDPYNTEDMKKIWSYKKNHDGGIIITKYKGQSPHIVFPERIGKTPVTCIGDMSFDIGVEKVESITIPSSVKEIDSCAFYKCTALTSLELPDSVTRIESFAFGKCSNLASIRFSSNIEYIGLDAFINTPWLDNNAEEIIYIGTCLYRFKDDSLSSYKVKEGTTCISGRAFQDMNNLEHVELPSSLLNLESYAFMNCSRLRNIRIPEKVKQINISTFSGCTCLEDIELSSNIEAISASSFDNCSSLRRFVFPEKVKKIEKCFFRGCTNLESITINRNMEEFPEPYYIHDVISDCSMLTELKVEEGNPKYHSENNCIIDTVRKTIVLGCVSSSIPESPSVKAIGAHAFNGCQIASIIIPSNIVSIEEFAFSSCKNLSHVELSEGLYSIGNYAFSDCISLKEIHIPDSAKEFGEFIFAGTRGLTYYASESSPIHKRLKEDENERLRRLFRF